MAKPVTPLDSSVNLPLKSSAVSPCGLHAVDVRTKYWPLIKTLLEEGEIEVHDRYDAWSIRRTFPNMTTIEKTGRTSRRIKMINPHMKLIETRQAHERYKTRIILDEL